jgi:predicted O-methyltransferase YrrM
MEPVNEQLLERVETYVEGLFVPADPALADNLRDAQAAGLPEIQVTANQGKLLYLLMKIAGAKRVLEIGTLGGYSTTWLARAVPADGKVTTLELETIHAAVARKNIDRAGVSQRVEIIVGPAADSLRRLIREKTPPFDAVFIDADKTGYAEYLDLVLQLSRPGTVILADNLIRHGRVMEPSPPDDSDRAVRAFNEILARHPRLETIILPTVKQKVDGISISRVR